MTGSDHSPRAWRVVEVGPGGVPVDQLRPVQTEVAQLPGQRPVAPDTGRPPSTTGPSAVFADFDFPPPETGFDSGRAAGAGSPSRRAVLAWFAIAVGLAVLAAALLWSDPAPSPARTRTVAAGSCLTSSSGRSVVVVDCADADVEFTVAATYPGTANGSLCQQVSSDLTLVTTDRVVLCLNYRAAPGDCLYAGRAEEVGKAPCRVPGSTRTPTGLFRVIAVLPGTVDVGGCPPGTISSFVHRTVPEVLCLGVP